LTAVGALDVALVFLVALRLGTVLMTFAAGLIGFSIRYTMRTTGWSRPTVRLMTALTWAAVIAIPARPLLSGNPEPAVHGGYVAVGLLGIAAILIYGFGGIERARAALEARPRGRIALFRAVNDAFADLPTVATPEDRARLDEKLAALDRYVEPDTFEFVQLARSRAVSWLEGGPRVPLREARWSARMQELSAQVLPPWAPDRLAHVSQRIRRATLPNARWIAIAGGAVIGRSALAGPVVVATLASIVLGYLLTWRWVDAAPAALIGGAAGLAATAAFQLGHRPSATIATALGCAVVLAVIAELERRRGRASRRLRVIDGTPSAPPSPTAPRAS
jgi:hypothetical protein